MQLHPDPPWTGLSTGVSRRMKFTSIHDRLIFWIGLLVSLILLLGSLGIHQTMRQELTLELDERLESILALVAIELETVDGEIVHEWLMDIQTSSTRSARDYVQLWDETSGETLRSPALQGVDLPKIMADDDLPHFAWLTLPNGNPGRAVAKRIQPVPEHEPTGDFLYGTSHLSEPDRPFTMMIALDAKRYEAVLMQLKGTLLLGFIFALLGSIIAIRLIISYSFRPIYQLERVVQGVDVNDPKDIFDLPGNLPSELSGIVTRYRDLLFRISHVRARERDFSSNVAHELRTPLAGIQATLEQALAIERGTQDYQQRIAEALQITLQMGDLVNRLLWFTRLLYRTEKVTLAEVDLQQLIEVRLAILNEQIESRGLRVKMDFEEDSPVIESDEGLLTILLNNLLGNAVAHSDRGTQVHLQTHRSDTGIILEIRNVAEAFNAAAIERIFEPFYQQDRVRSADGEHFGIGLSLSREIARMLHIQLEARFDAVKKYFTVAVVFPKK